VGACAVVVPIIDRQRNLSEKIEDTFLLKIKETSQEMARGILANPKLENITEVIRDQLLKLGAEVASVTLNNIALEEQQNNASKTKGNRSRTLNTILGPVDYERKAFYNAESSSLSFPADDTLGIHAGQIQSDVLKRVIKLGIEVPFKEASELCESLMGVTVSEGSIHGGVVKAGQQAQYKDVVPTKEEIHQKLDKLKNSNPHEKAHIVIGVDGAMEPLRPENSLRKGKRGECFWKECKGFRVYATVGEKTIEHLISWHQIGNDEDLGKHLAYAAESLEGRCEQIVVVADGAKWIWNQISKTFKSHIEIIDWYHVVEHLSGYADTQFGKDNEKKQAWLEEAKLRLMNNDVGRIIHGLVRMSHRNSCAKEASEKLRNYLKSNKERMKYGTFKKQNLTIGSGGMESANKSVAHIRLKRNGCWWKSPHANEMLRLRCAKTNGTLERFLSNCWKKGLRLITNDEL